MQTELRITADGSHTLYVPEMEETYHSLFGAVTESLHVFIENGCNHCNKNPLHILEIGFGTGLNAWLTLIEAEKRKVAIYYSTYELYPLNNDQISFLNYSKQFFTEYAEYFGKIHALDWGKMYQVTQYFSLCKLNRDVVLENIFEKYDVIYFDAFAPSKQPEMWTEEMLVKMYRVLSAGGILVTYCAKGDVRRTMQRIGFSVEKLKGPLGGKREMIRGIRLS